MFSGGSPFAASPQMPYSHFDSVRGLSPFAIASAVSALSHGTMIERAGSLFTSNHVGSCHISFAPAPTTVARRAIATMVFLILCVLSDSCSISVHSTSTSLERSLPSASFHVRR